LWIPAWAETLAKRLDEDRRRGRVYVFMSNLHQLFGELNEAFVTAPARSKSLNVWGI
jgi:hypothetical protein